ncbi:MAG: copper resistance protein NlpE N-terminal domain-containing protein [Flavobacteriales bacterium]
MSKTSSLLPILLLAFASCQSPAPPEKQNAASGADTTEQSTPSDWVGLYSNTLPCADCPGILTELELRADSIFILRERYLERDSVPFGHIGRWSIAQGKLVLAMGGGAGPEHWKPTADGLEQLGLNGSPIEDTHAFTIHRVKNIGTSPMRLTGAYVFDGGSNNFKPCGSAYAFPVALDMPDDHGAGLSLEKLYKKQVKHIGDPLFVDVVVDVRVGPAMEGDGTEEYLHIDELQKVLDVDQCP